MIIEIKFLFLLSNQQNYTLQDILMFCFGIVFGSL